MWLLQTRISRLLLRLFDQRLQILYHKLSNSPVDNLNYLILRIKIEVTTLIHVIFFKIDLMDIFLECHVTFNI